MWVRTRSTSPWAPRSETCRLIHTVVGYSGVLNYAWRSGSVLWAVHLARCLGKQPALSINEGRHIYVQKHTQTAIIRLDISPSFMLWLMPAPPGLTGRNAQLQVWRGIFGTDGTSFQHHLLCFFQTTCSQDQTPNPPDTVHPMGKDYFCSLAIWAAYRWAPGEILIPPTQAWRESVGLKPEWAPSGGLVLSAFHSPAPTGSYGIQSRMDRLRNIFLWNNS